METPQGDPAPAGPASAPSPEPTPAPAPDAAAPVDEPGTGAAQDAPLATAVQLTRIEGEVVLDGVGTVELCFDFTDGLTCDCIIDGDPVEGVEIQWPPEADTHTSVQACLVNAAQQGAQKASA